MKTKRAPNAPAMETWKGHLFLGGAPMPNADADADSPLATMRVDIESVISLFIYEHLGRPKQIKLTMIEMCSDGQFSVSVDRNQLTRVEGSADDEIILPNELVQLPAIVIIDDAGATRTVISGLCSVCRAIVQLSGQVDILGFKRGCLAAPSEASVWTKFCEIDVLRLVDRLLKSTEEETSKLDVDLARFEMHLKQPVRIHNFAKVIQDMQKVTISDDNQLLEKDENDAVVIKHQFVEGPKMFLADLILFSVFYFVFRRMSTEELKSIMPLTVKWYETMKSLIGVEILDKLTQGMVRKIY